MTSPGTIPIPSDGEQSVTVTVTQLYQSESCPPTTNPPTTAYAQKFLEGEPKALGVTQIMNGLVQISLGIPLCVTTSFLSTLLGAPFVIGVMFIVSGAMCIAAEKEPSIKLLRACLSSNVASSLLASSAIIIYMADTLNAQHCTDTYAKCTADQELSMISYRTLVILLMFTFLQLTISITIAVYVCKSTRCCHPYSSMPLIVHDVNIDEDQ